MSVGHEVDDEVDVRAPSVSEKERGKGGARVRVGLELGRGCCGRLAREKGRGEGREKRRRWAAAVGRVRGRGRD